MSEAPQSVLPEVGLVEPTSPMAPKDRWPLFLLLAVAGIGAGVMALRAQSAGHPAASASEPHPVNTERVESQLGEPLPDNSETRASVRPRSLPVVAAPAAAGPDGDPPDEPPPAASAASVPADSPDEDPEQIKSAAVSLVANGHSKDAIDITEVREAASFAHDTEAFRVAESSTNLAHCYEEVAAGANSQVRDDVYRAIYLVNSATKCLAGFDQHVPELTRQVSRLASTLGYQGASLVKEGDPARLDLALQALQASKDWFARNGAVNTDFDDALATAQARVQGRSQDSGAASSAVAATSSSPMVNAE